MCLDSRDNASIRYLRWRGNYEEELRSLFLTFIGHLPGCVVIDVGASYGAYALAAASLARYTDVSRIFAVEVDSRCFDALRRSKTANGFDDTLLVLWGAAGADDGETTLFLSARASTSNRTFSNLGDPDEHFAETRRIRVPSIRLDSHVHQRVKINHSPVVVKIDVEGSESRVLSGLTDTLRAAGEFAIMIEFYPTGMQACGTLPETLMDALHPLEPTGFAARVGDTWSAFSNFEQFSKFLIEYFDTHVGMKAAADLVVTRGDRPGSTLADVGRRRTPA